MEDATMGTTVMEARGNVCLLVLVNPNENPYEKCCPGECSVWSWEEGCNASGNRLGHCILVGKTERPARSDKKTRGSFGGSRASARVTPVRALR
jgi:hypothetical protein